jgi:hypothetical protein
MHTFLDLAMRGKKERLHPFDFYRTLPALIVAASTARWAGTEYIAGIVQNRLCDFHPCPFSGDSGARDSESTPQRQRQHYHPYQDLTNRIHYSCPLTEDMLSVANLYYKPLTKKRRLVSNLRFLQQSPKRVVCHRPQSLARAWRTCDAIAARTSQRYTVKSPRQEYSCPQS